MALIKCPECGKDLSSMALSCPHCGFQKRATNSQQVVTTSGATGKFLDPMSNARSCLGCIGLIVIGAIVIFILGVIASLS
jgi:uncharacterized membrane protein YvbJ